MKVKDQLITERYAIYNSDCMEVLQALPDQSIGMIMESPPFGSSMYNHSSDERDLSNCKDHEEFFKQYEFIVKEQSRVIQNGRMACIHCADISMGNYLIDLPGQICKLYESYGFDYCGRVTIWKEPLRVAIRTRALSLRQSQIVKDATRCFPAAPDYLLLMRKGGTNRNPVAHPEGLTVYAGEENMNERLKMSLAPIPSDNETGLDLKSKLLRWVGMADGTVQNLKETYKNSTNPKTNKWSHWVWQHYASSVWGDVRVRHILPFKNAKETPEERHPHPTQRDVWVRCLQMWSNPKDKILTCFMGVGSEVFESVENGRFGIGAELKTSYYRQAVANMALIGTEQANEQLSLLDEPDTDFMEEGEPEQMEALA
jgi:DNA modification methylase